MFGVSEFLSPADVNRKIMCRSSVVPYSFCSDLPSGCDWSSSGARPGEDVECYGVWAATLQLHWARHCNANLSKTALFCCEVKDYCLLCIAVVVDRARGRLVTSNFFSEGCCLRQTGIAVFEVLEAYLKLLPVWFLCRLSSAFWSWIIL